MKPSIRQVAESFSRHHFDETFPSMLASCDIYDFTHGNLAAITSYTVELDAASASS